ncbi:MAG: hypothetical protein DRR19_23780 [Candidatus Parabeggiatoa sp. nov. 1]|nr:MAG: hypothetical protein DRR19_23780 [Gammaproteobacteria bacterium]
MPSNSLAIQNEFWFDWIKGFNRSPNFKKILSYKHSLLLEKAVSQLLRNISVSKSPFWALKIEFLV